MKCSNCGDELGPYPLVTPSGEMVCDGVCLQGWDNGRKMREIVELGDKWGKFFQELDRLHPGWDQCS